MSQIFDVIVIGAGPGGYIAAIRAAQLGLSVACIDAWQTESGAPAPGGTCTNVGCIPSKALLQSSEHYAHARDHFSEHGIEVKGLGLKLDALLGRKNTVVKQNNDGILYLFKKNKVSFLAVWRDKLKAVGRCRLRAKTQRNSSANTWCWQPAHRRARCPGCRLTKKPSCPTTAR